MAAITTIEWTERSWNPVTGCTKVSQGCHHCYAERIAKRLQLMGARQYRNGFRVTLAPHALAVPFRWSKPRLIFVNSMSDLFHEQVPLSYIRKVFDVMQRTPHHTYQILTKRSERLLALADQLSWTPNIWMGVSVENQKATNRIRDLASTPAYTKFVSLEPLLGPVRNLYLNRIHWVIVGGESGPKARRMDQAWVCSIQAQCKASGVPFFFKQWGKVEFNQDSTDPTINKSHPYHAKGGCRLVGQVYREMPERSPTSICSECEPKVGDY